MSILTEPYTTKIVWKWKKLILDKEKQLLDFLLAVL